MGYAKKETMARYYEDPLHVQLKRLHGRKSDYKKRKKWDKVEEMEKEISKIHEIKKLRMDLVPQNA